MPQRAKRAALSGLCAGIVQPGEPRPNPVKPLSSSQLPSDPQQRGPPPPLAGTSVTMAAHNGGVPLAALPQHLFGLLALPETIEEVIPHRAEIGAAVLLAR